MKKLYKVCALFLFLFSSVALSSQSVAPVTATNVAGGIYDNPSSYFRFEWSFGEISLIQTFSPADISLYITQGVLQPLTEKAMLSPHLLIFTKDDYSLFPNPTSGRFEVNFSVRQSGHMVLQLSDLTGRILQSRAFHYFGWGHIEKYDLTNYPNGTYFVIATLTPDTPRPGDQEEVIRRSGFRLVKFK
jgi:hypothetical protein